MYLITWLPQFLHALVEREGTPLQVYEEHGIRHAAQRLHAAFQPLLPSFREYFAVKATPNPAILRALLDEGCGLDCSSRVELELASRLGCPGERIMFTSNYTSEEDLASAARMGVVINLDDDSLLDALARVPTGFPDTICFRLNPGRGGTDSAIASNVLAGPASKFGIPPTRMAAAYARAKALGAKRFGMHMMCGSCVMGTEYWREMVTVMMQCVESVLRETGVWMDFVNIGGGLGIPYRPEDAEVDVAAVAAVVAEVVSAKCEALGQPVPALCMENGRFMTGPSGWLVTRFYGVDACMAHLMRPGMYGAYHHVTVPEAEGRSAARVAANVVGTLCENNDWFCRERELPEAAVGDLFVIHDTGAHGHAMGFQYNGALRAPEVLLRQDGASELIRRRETFEDYVATVPLSAWRAGAARDA